MLWESLPSMRAVGSTTLLLRNLNPRRLAATKKDDASFLIRPRCVLLLNFPASRDDNNWRPCPVPQAIVPIGFQGMGGKSERTQGWNPSVPPPAAWPALNLPPSPQSH